MLIGERRREPRQTLRVRKQRRHRAVDADERHRPRRRIVAHHHPVDLEQPPHRTPRREPGAAAPPERPARQIEAIRLAAPFVARIPGDLDHLRHVLAADEVDREVRLPRAVPFALVARRDLQHAAHPERRRLLPVFGQEIHFPSDIPVAHVVARPHPVHPRIPVDEAPEGRVGHEDRPHVAVDPRVDQKRGEHLRPLPEADRHGRRKVADVGVPLLVIRAAPIAAHRPLTVRQHLRGRHKPQPGVAEERRRRRTGFLCRWRRRLGLCRRRLSVRSCGSERQRGEKTKRASMAAHQSHITAGVYAASIKRLHGFVDFEG